MWRNACCEVVTVTDLVKISGIVRRINEAKARSELDIIVTEMMRHTFEDRELKRFPVELNRWDSHGSRDERVFEH